MAAALTVSERGVELLRLPDVPEIVIVVVPVVAVPLAVSVSVLVVAVLAGLKAAVMPFGNPEAARFTVPLKPFCAFTVTEAVPLAP